ncbi:MAG: PepSY-like domain-containing protein [Paludibacteraceae bacterium]|nr:PepSY-like domain-containing protein [Paludibacteraceae bacterium]
MKKILFVICATMLTFAAEAKNSELKIEYDQIPEKAQQFVSEFYKDVPVKKVSQKFDDGIAQYVVYLKDKTVIEFDMVGAWNYVQSPKKKVAVITTFIPAKVKDTLLKRFADKIVYKIATDGFWYEASFSDGSNVKINANGDAAE